MNIQAVYNHLVDELTLAQYTQIMGGDMRYADKARRAKLISKSRNVHHLANVILFLSGEPHGLDALQVDNINRANRGELIGE